MSPGMRNVTAPQTEHSVLHLHASLPVLPILAKGTTAHHDTFDLFHSSFSIFPHVIITYTFHLQNILSPWLGSICVTTTWAHANHYLLSLALFTQPPNWPSLLSRLQSLLSHSQNDFMKLKQENATFCSNLFSVLHRSSTVVYGGGPFSCVESQLKSCFLNLFLTLDL